MYVRRPERLRTPLVDFFSILLGFFRDQQVISDQGSNRLAPDARYFILCLMPAQGKGSRRIVGTPLAPHPMELIIEGTKMRIRHFFDERTFTLTYVVHDEDARIGVVIDPVMDYDPKSGRIWHESAEKVYRYIEDHELEILFVIDTHAHADHLSGMQYFKKRCAAQTLIGVHITSVQERFRDLYNLGTGFPADGRQFDFLFQEGRTLEAGPLRIEAFHTPGHTPACMTYKIGDALFVGDVLFMPDYGTARCDFPGGSAAQLYDSIQKLYRLPGETRVFTCHDYQPGDRELRFETTIQEERSANIQLNSSTSRDEFVAFRKERDAKLEMPTLILPSLQVNIRAGRLPEPESNGVSYLKIPLNQL